MSIQMKYLIDHRFAIVLADSRGKGKIEVERGVGHEKL